MAEVVDVVVVGAGGAGMTAALTARHRGLDTLVVEKSPWFGGSTSRSGGGVWIPNNYALRKAGRTNTLAEAQEYLRAIIGDVVAKERIDAFLEKGPEALEFVRDHSAARFVWVPEYSDYYPEAPGGHPRGRSVEPVPVDGRIIGAELRRLHPAYTKAPVGLVVTQADYRWLSLATRTPRGPLTAAKVGLRRLLNLALRRPVYGMGQAMMIGMRKGLLDAGIPIRYNTELVGLVLEDHRVTGVRVRRDGEEQVIAARRGVVVASGGFERNQEMRERYQRSPVCSGWTTGAPSNTGGGIAAGIAAGADVALMDDAWWGPSIPLPSGPWFCLAERNLPGSIIVNQAGRRYANEAAPYVDAVHAMYDGHAATGISHVPSWMVLDQRYRNRYLFAGLAPRQPFPGRWYQHGAVFRADTLEALAEQIGVDPGGLAGTVAGFNEMARSGIDRDFHRGDSAYDAYYGDPRNKPNPSLGVIDRAPYYAVRMVPGDLGTKGGIVTDEHARALRPDGSVIEGLYAAGNAGAAVMGHTYAGAGATIGPAMTFGYIAAHHIADHTGTYVPIDAERAVGAALPDLEFAWTSSDVLLYHLALGAGSRPGDQTDPAALRYTLDDDHLQVLPSFGIVAPHVHDTDAPSLDLPGCEIGLSQMLHGSQEVVVPAPLPTEARATLHTRISDVWDKGDAAVIVQEAEAVDARGSTLFTTRSSIFVRGEGGWGGDRGPSSRVEPPDREPDVDTAYSTTPNQALLYRLCGDRNPLHSDPGFAKGAGFPAPILHGLCTYGVVLRTVVEAALESDSAQVRGFTARFAGVVFPGETIRVQAWDEGERLLVAASVDSDHEERDGAPVLADCVLTRA